MKKILTFVFKHPLGDCSNNGLTSKVNNVDLYSEVTESDYEALESLDDDVLVLVKRGSFMGRQLGDIAVPFSIYEDQGAILWLVETGLYTLRTLASLERLLFQFTIE